MRATPEAQEWYFFKAGSNAGLKAGPFSWEQLRRQAQDGVLEPKDVVWDSTSGWRTAEQVVGLFSVEMAGSGPGSPHPVPSMAGRGRPWLAWLPALVALIIVGGGLGAYFGFSRDHSSATAARQTTTVAAPATTTPTPTTEMAAHVQPTTTASGTTSTTEPPAIYLDKGDFGHEVSLHVGERVRIDLTPYVGDRVKSVKWNYVPIIVQEADAGQEVVEDVVVACWLTLEAIVAGPVTVRAEYEYPNGSKKAIWVVYLRVTG